MGRWFREDDTLIHFWKDNSPDQSSHNSWAELSTSPSHDGTLISWISQVVAVLTIFLFIFIFIFICHVDRPWPWVSELKSNQIDSLYCISCLFIFFRHVFSRHSFYCHVFSRLLSVVRVLSPSVEQLLCSMALWYYSLICIRILILLMANSSIRYKKKNYKYSIRFNYNLYCSESDWRFCGS